MWWSAPMSAISIWPDWPSPRATSHSRYCPGLPPRAATMCKTRSAARGASISHRSACQPCARPCARLRSGGLVSTGVDRPDPTSAGEPLTFFGQPAYLPTGHVRLALQANAPIAVAMVRNNPARPHAYVVDVEPPLELEMIGHPRRNDSAQCPARPCSHRSQHPSQPGTVVDVLPRLAGSPAPPASRPEESP